MKSAIVPLFGLTSMLAAWLFFSAEPLIGKLVLPVLGGTPAVWNTCLLFYQVMLLGGYLLAHALGIVERAWPHRGWVAGLVMFGTLVAAGYAIQPIALWPGAFQIASMARSPALALLRYLFASAAVPLIVVSATAPLLQVWIAVAGHPRAHDPYFLYAASNAGSLLGLVAYPFVIEPNLGLSVQSNAWRTGFVVLAVLVFTCGTAARRLHLGERAAILTDENGRRQLSDTRAIVHVTPAQIIEWLLLVFVPSSWLMGVTSYLTTDLAPIPLFWVVPLALYLLSFIIAFASSGEGLVRITQRVLPYIVAPLALVMSAGFVHVVWLPLHLLAFFCGSLACHGLLIQSRPAARHATLFYIVIATGGLLGGALNALVAPLIFTRVVEYPLALVLACMVALRLKGARGVRSWRQRLTDLIIPLVVFLLMAVLVTNQAGLADSVLGVLGVMGAAGSGMLACVTARARPVRFALTIGSVFAASGLTQAASGHLLDIERNFFGVVRVTFDRERNAHRLFHGSTLHGQQSLIPGLRKEPSTFFTRSGPVGQVFATAGPLLDKRDARVAIVGLGVGTLASYGRPGQEWAFYEIDPAVVRIARDPRFFTYLNDSQAGSIEIILGDARIRLREAPARCYQLIVLDAFSSDAVPVHLLSREAIGLYRAKLAPGGLLMFNLSNRYLDLDVIMGRQAADAGLVCRVRYDLTVSEEDNRLGKQPSIWAVLAETERDLGELASDPRWRPAAPRSGSRAWTDDYSDVASYLLLTPGQRWNRQKPGSSPGDPGKRPAGGAGRR